ncbi:GlxA family transcriptional regulator [Rhodococcus opacus]|uniref:GlxA family transcriptional regulator n=1 Tax=Rhodococcus opacus TaxID=37919 RepID=UPI00046D25E6|nr:helix-turn-helix domain-containing protein [Rhodococcus opacus]UDG96831.1 helix-turn-helix domain-containing protein [Rhodococcus opacus PD630]
MRVAVLAVDGMFDSGLSVMLDVLATADALRDDAEAGDQAFTVIPVAVGPSVRTGHGLVLATAPLTEIAEPPDVLVMPALGVKTPDRIVDVVRGHPALDWVAEGRSSGAALAAACSGTFFLAEAGVLDGLTATTSWWLGPAFRARYARVDLDERRTLIHDDRVTTAGAAFAHIDLALAIVQQHSPALADLVARYLLIGDRPSQAIFAVPSLLATADPTMTAFERWIRDHLAEPLPINSVAHAIGVSERTLQRTTAAVLGMSPVEFVQEIRLDQATFLLRTTQHSVDTIASAVGYQNSATLRALIRRRRHTSTTEIRRGNASFGHEHRRSGRGARPGR